jgi:hydroxyethylthiazole kinase
MTRSLMTTTAEYLRHLRAAKPLVYHITNVVTVSDCANATLLVGGLPVMANSPREAEAMVGLAQALVLNIGTLHEEQVEAMLIAGRRANELGLPIILDPVGAGATAYRTQTAQHLLVQLEVAVIKGNAGEIATLAGEQAEVRGVESGIVTDVVSPARALSHDTGAVVAVTGARDVVVHGTGAGWVEGGSPRMSTFVGSGCVATCLVGCFVGAHPDAPFEATLAALRFYRAAAARAAAANPLGPLAFREAVWDQLALLQPEDLEAE